MMKKMLLLLVLSTGCGAAWAGDKVYDCDYKSLKGKPGEVVVIHSAKEGTIEFTNLKGKTSQHTGDLRREGDFLSFDYETGALFKIDNTISINPHTKEFTWNYGIRGKDRVTYYGTCKKR
ncbi:hypothetical protein [Shewanella sp. YIC-542]|uniref:hypothetical protein n=1 Tax=Shewanella mytili TaxID=3377111 RepID=UPI00398F0CFA